MSTDTTADRSAPCAAAVGRPRLPSISQVVSGTAQNIPDRGVGARRAIELTIGGARGKIQKPNSVDDEQI
jgi:hypothetical protein